MSTLNDAPLMSGIREALIAGDVPFEEEDFEALVRHRRARNALDHGKPLILPSAKDVRRVIGLLTRALAWRLSKAGST